MQLGINRDKNKGTIIYENNQKLLIKKDSPPPNKKQIEIPASIPKANNISPYAPSKFREEIIIIEEDGTSY